MDVREGTFDENLKRLLTRAYEVPEYREEFRAELLGRLKDSQRMKALQRARRQGGRSFVLGALSGLAAAALVVLTLLPQLLTGAAPAGVSPSGQLPAVDEGVAVAEQPRAPAEAAPARLPADAGSGMVAEQPAPTGRSPESVGGGTLVAAAGNADPQPMADLLVELRAAPAGVSPSARLVHDRTGSIEYRAGGSDAWQTVGSTGTFVLSPGTQMRSAASSLEPVGVWLDEKTKLVMNPGGKVTADEEGIRLENGSILLVLDEGKDPLRVHLPEHQVLVQPGTELYARVRNDSQYAPDGAPAPTVIVLKGRADVVRAGGEGPALLAGKIYELYDTVNGEVPSRDLCDLMRQQVKVLPAQHMKALTVSEP